MGKVFLVGFLSSLCINNISQADRLKTSTGFSYFNGDYGKKDKITIIHSNITIDYQGYPWRSKLTLPFLKINSYGGIDGNGNIINHGKTTQKYQSGIGDLRLQLSYLYLFPQHKNFFKHSFLKLATKIKFPTANPHKGLGTGEIDYTIESQFIKKIRSFSLFVTQGYIFVGKSSKSILNNRYYANLGSVYQINKQLNMGLMYTYKQASTNIADSDQKIISFVDWKIPNTQWQIESHLIAGLTHSTIDYGVGFNFSYALEL